MVLFTSSHYTMFVIKYNVKSKKTAILTKLNIIFLNHDLVHCNFYILIADSY